MISTGVPITCTSGVANPGVRAGRGKGKEGGWRVAGGGYEGRHEGRHTGKAP